MRDFMKRMNCRASRVMNTSLRHTTAMFNSSGSRMGSPQARTFLASPAAAAAAALEGKIVHPGKYLGKKECGTQKRPAFLFQKVIP